MSMKKTLVLTGVLLVVAAILAACGSQAAEAPAVEQPTEAPAVEQPTEAPAMPELIGDALRGGKLYDNWMEELGVDAPEGDQPLWATQSSNTRSGGDTWRCKECHGWDYKGADGAYGSGSHLTGFPGVYQLADEDPSVALDALVGGTNPDHDFSAYLDEQALTDLALFISEEVIDTETVISLSGDTDNGKTLFENNCVDCHGPEALAINFHPDSEPEYPATIANENPLEFLSKLRVGQPGVADMPSGIDNGWTEQEYADVIAYVQTLPESSPAVEGGRMYDNWIEALAVTAPESDMPLWATQTTNTRSGEDTWRCKECHGWDYKGVGGVYGSGSHMTGFKGVMDAANMSAEEIIAWLDGTSNADHDFSSFFTADDMARMAAFIQEGMVDKTFINEDKTVTGGDAEHGKQLFNQVCSSCHGEDGASINFADGEEKEFVGTVAADNPWEFFNKATVGQPGEPMPAGWDLGWSQQDIIDLLTFAQSLPTQ